MSVHWQDSHCTTVMPYLLVSDGRGMLDFLVKVFEGSEEMAMPGPDGSVMHAEVQIGDTRVMLGQIMQEQQKSQCSSYVYVPDVDAACDRAVEAGAELVRPPEDQFYGDRQGTVRDPEGNIWFISTHIEDVSEEEMARRHEEFAKQQNQ